MTALERFTETMREWEEPDPVERLRFFCSCAMVGQDWLDIEPFFDAVLEQRANIIRTPEQHRAFLAEADQLVNFDPAANTPDGIRLALVSEIVEAYEKRRFPL